MLISLAFTASTLYYSLICVKQENRWTVTHVEEWIYTDSVLAFFRLSAYIICSLPLVMAVGRRRNSVFWPSDRGFFSKFPQIWSTCRDCQRAYPQLFWSHHFQGCPQNHFLVNIFKHLCLKNRDRFFCEIVSLCRHWPYPYGEPLKLIDFAIPWGGKGGIFW